MCKITFGSGRVGGPRLRAVDPWLRRNSPSTPHQLLSDDERARLATMATIVRFKKGEQVYSDGEPAKEIFNIISGLIKIYKPRPDGGEYVSAFLYPEDLFGLSEEGRYVNSAKAITPAIFYSLPLDAIRRRCPRAPTWSSTLSRSFVTSFVRHNVTLFCLHKDTPYQTGDVSADCRNMFSRPTSPPRRYTYRWTAQTSQTSVRWFARKSRARDMILHSVDGASCCFRACTTSWPDGVQSSQRAIAEGRLCV